MVFKNARSATLDTADREKECLLRFEVEYGSEEMRRCWKEKNVGIGQTLSDSKDRTYSAYKD